MVFRILFFLLLPFVSFSQWVIQQGTNIETTNKNKRVTKSLQVGDDTGTDTLAGCSIGTVIYFPYSAGGVVINNTTATMNLDTLNLVGNDVATMEVGDEYVKIRASDQTVVARTTAGLANKQMNLNANAADFSMTVDSLIYNSGLYYDTTGGGINTPFVEMSIFNTNQSFDEAGFFVRHEINHPHLETKIHDIESDSVNVLVTHSHGGLIIDSTACGGIKFDTPNGIVAIGDLDPVLIIAGIKFFQRGDAIIGAVDDTGTNALTISSTGMSYGGADTNSLVNLGITGGAKASNLGMTRNSFDLSLGTTLVRVNGQSDGDLLLLSTNQVKLSATDYIEADNDIVMTSTSKGLVLKDNAGTPHYWRVTINSAGTLVTTDLGTSPP